MGKWSRAAKKSFREKMRARRGTIVVSEETRQRMSEARIKYVAEHGMYPNLIAAAKRPKSEATKAKMRKAKLGTTQSPEHRANRSAAMLAWWAKRKAEAVV